MSSKNNKKPKGKDGMTDMSYFASNKRKRRR